MARVMTLFDQRGQTVHGNQYVTGGDQARVVSDGITRPVSYQTYVWNGFTLAYVPGEDGEGFEQLCARVDVLNHRAARDARRDRVEQTRFYSGHVIYDPLGTLEQR